MDYEFWKEIHDRGGIPAVKSALEDLPGDLAPQDADATTALALKVIEDDIARINARADRAEARARELAEQTREVNQQLTEHAALATDAADATDDAGTPDARTPDARTPDARTPDDAPPGT
ncbi:hypothetical protein AB0N81_36610 [Streptomyces sp. NPDC093510]|uniref:hypothetical protein n=1 Tax=Streptomyces sp. NPDC093510 TaxID=3155199 RepID=UPI00341A4258